MLTAQTKRTALLVVALTAAFTLVMTALLRAIGMLPAMS